MDLATALRSHVVAIDKQIEVVREQAHDMSIPPEYLKYADGKYVLTDLLLAKANALAGMAYLKSQ